MVGVSVLLIGEGDFKEFELLSKAVEDRGGETVVCDVTDWPGEAEMTYDPAESGVTLGRKIEFDEVSGAYVLPTKLFQPLELRFHESLSEDLRPTLNQLREYHTMLESTCVTLDEQGVDMIPPFRNHNWHHRKPWQMKFLEAEDIPIPETLFTNYPDEVLDFYEEHEKVIYKPVTRSGAPKMLTEDDLTDSRLEDLATAPVQFQTFAPGDDLRVYFLDGEVIGGMRYLSDDFSFKLDMQDGKEIEVESFDPPAEMRDTIEKVAEKSGLVFGGADIRFQASGEFKLLELNDVPRFAAADLRAGQNVAESLTDYLLE